jgi:ribosomal-protein-alanine N-acetyltransferase
MRIHQGVILDTGSESIHSPISSTGDTWETNRSAPACGNSMVVETTDRMRLVAGTKILAAAEIADRAKFARLLGASVPETWPPDSIRDVSGYLYGLYEEHPEWESWLTWYAIRIDSDYSVLCGSIGFKGPPDKRGIVEIGYSVLPEFQGQGLATEMVAGIIQWAKHRPGVRRIEAETNIDNRASIRVLKKNSFIRVGAGLEPNTIRFLLQF